MTPADLTQLALAVVLGGGLGVGAALVLWATPRWRAPSLTRRVAPYLRDIADPQGLTPLRAPGPLGRAGAAGWADRTWFGRIGGAEDLARRLRRAGWSTDAAGFRARQLGWGIGGLAAGAVVAIGLVIGGAGSPIVAVMPVLLAIAGVLGYDTALTAAARSRAARAQEELPTVLEFLALCLAAGEGAFDAIRRVAAVGSGELVQELRRAVVAVGTGSPLGDALSRLGRDLDTAAVTRSVDQIVAAIDSGAPLAQVLQAQASDAREDAKRVLIEKAGRKEIYMLLPLVFLILPLSVLFAIFPGVVMLRLGMG